MLETANSQFLPKGENCEFAVSTWEKEMLNAIRLNILSRAKSANSQISHDNAEACARHTRLAQSGYLFLRVLPVGYDWGNNPDPDGLLPNIFAKKG